MALENTDFHRLVMSLNPGVYLPLGLGDIRRRDGNSTVRPTIDNTPKWRGLEVGPGYALDPQLTGAIRCAAADVSEINVTDFTLFAAGQFADPDYYSTSQRIMSHRDGGTLVWTWYISFTGGSSRIRIYNGTDSQISAVLSNIRTVSAKCESGTPPKFFANGTYIGAGNNSLTYATDPVDLYIANYHPLDEGVKGGLSLALIFPSLLTDEQIYDIDRLWNGLQGVSQRTHISCPVQLDQSSELPQAVFSIIGERNGSNEAIDLGPNGLNAPVSGRIGCTKQIPGEALEYYGAGDGIAVVPSNAAWQDLDNVTVVIHAAFNSAGPNNNGVIFKVENGSDYWSLEFGDANGRLDWFVRYADGLADWQSAVDCPLDGELHTIIMTHAKSDPTEDPVLYIDGESIVMNANTSRTGVMTSDSGAHFNIGNYDGLDEAVDGLIARLDVYDEILDADELRAAYLVNAVRPVELVDRFSRPETLGASGVQAGPWEVGSGDFEWLDDGERKWLYADSSGWCVTSSKLAYGAWYFRMLRPIGVGSINICFIASARENVNGVNQNGYDVFFSSADDSLRIRRRTGGAGTDIIDSGAGYLSEGVEYEVFVTRRPIDSSFSLYVKGGVYAVWTFVGSVVDSSHTVSSFVSSFLTEDCGISDFLFMPEGYTVDPREVELPWSF